jgi:S1-C subfamily serine protease
MLIAIRRLWTLGFLLSALGGCRGADKPLSRAELNKVGKAATAFVEFNLRGMRSGYAYGSAFCIHRSGWFVTNEHVVRGEGNVVLVLDSGLQSEAAYGADVVHTDKDLDLALLRAKDARYLPALSLGSDEGLEELMEVVAFGFPFAKTFAPSRNQYPTVSVNAGRITALRRKGGNLDRLQLDAELNPGNSGGPILNENGKVIGVVVSGVQGSGVNFAIPVSVLSRFLDRPDVQFDPPVVGPAKHSRAGAVRGAGEDLDTLRGSAGREADPHAVRGSGADHTARGGR